MFYHQKLQTTTKIHNYINWYIYKLISIRKAQGTMKQGWKFSKSQGTRMSAARKWPQDMTWKMHPWALNNMIASTRLHNNISWHSTWMRKVPYGSAPKWRVIAGQWLLRGENQLLAELGSNIGYRVTNGQSCTHVHTGNTKWTQ